MKLELNELAQDATVAVRVVRGLVDAVEQAGVARLTFLRAAKLDALQLDAPDLRLPRAFVHRLCELAIELTDDPALGLHWAERISEATFAPISPLIAHASSLRQALDALVQFHRLLSDQAGYQVVELDDSVMVRASLDLTGESLRVQRFVAEMNVGGFFRLLRYFSVDARPERVSFQHAAPPYHEEYGRVFEHAQRFEQPFTGIVFSRALLDVPAPHKDEEVHQLLQGLAQRRLQQLGQNTPYARRVRDLLVESGAPQRIGMPTVARALGLSVRSLRRRLDAEGRSYHAVLNQALAIVARHLLRDKQRSIQETAYEMGFSDASAFHRAFKSWTGTTPSAYRKLQT